MKKYMTVKEIADFCERRDTTIRSWIKKDFPTVMENGKTTKLTVEQVELLLKNNLGTKITSLLFENLTNNVSQVANNVSNNCNTISMDMIITIATEMKNQMKRLDAIEEKVNHQQVMIEAPKSKSPREIVFDIVRDEAIVRNVDDINILWNKLFRTFGPRTGLYLNNMTKDQMFDLIESKGLMTDLIDHARFLYDLGNY